MKENGEDNDGILTAQKKRTEMTPNFDCFIRKENHMQYRSPSELTPITDHNNKKPFIKDYE